jgi:hypothetical protein
VDQSGRGIGLQAQSRLQKKKKEEEEKENDGGIRRIRILCLVSFFTLPTY